MYFYGSKLSVRPFLLGATLLEEGVERVVEIDLNKSEQAAFDASVSAVVGLCETCAEIAPNLK